MTAKPQPDTLSMWTVYRNPRDRPDKYAARRWEIRRGGARVATSDMFVADTLAEIRDLLPLGLICIERHRNDDPSIVEVWL